MQSMYSESFHTEGQFVCGWGPFEYINRPAACDDASRTYLWEPREK